MQSSCRQGGLGSRTCATWMWWGPFGLRRVEAFSELDQWLLASSKQDAKISRIFDALAGIQK
eukprot:11198157-Lingulodinium_polyedra.AAC.1